MIHRRFHAHFYFLAGFAALFLSFSTEFLKADTLKDGAQAEVIDREDRTAWWQEARFGLFIHWGLYSIPAGVWNGEQYTRHPGEWLMLDAKINAADYEKLAEEFNPVEFDADEWMRMAREAGIKYTVLVVKHHDGFALYDSEVSDWDIAITPFGRDIVREFVDAAHRHGIRVGLYYSLPDWHHREFPAKYNFAGFNREDEPFHSQPNPDADLDKYVEFMKAQLKEMITNYGPVDIMWFDGGASFIGYDRAGLIGGEELIKYVRSLQPNIIINDRLKIDADYGTPEQRIPEDASKEFPLWETCMTMNDTWGYRAFDDNWKSNKTLLRNLVEIVSKGGNLLLNVGPTSQGRFPQASVDALKMYADWMKVNGESIHGAGPSSIDVPKWGRYTQKSTPEGGIQLYAHVYDWPSDGKLLLGDLDGDVKSAFLLADPKRRSLEISHLPTGIEITLPATATDLYDSVVVLSFNAIN